MKQDMIVILDLGSTENTTLARAIRELGVYSEIYPHDITAEELKALPNVKGVVLNGGENRVVDGVPVDVSPELYGCGIPMLAVDHPTAQCGQKLQELPGRETLEKFVFTDCGAQANWNMKNFIADQVELIRSQVGEKKVLLALSGGVDSSVCAALLSKALPGQLHCIFVDHGLMRKDEGNEVEAAFKNRDLDFIRVNAQERFLKALAGVTDPEQKRKIIGTEFVRVFEDESKRLPNVKFLAQGTIYPDVIESGGNKAATIKSHHNVAGLPKDMKFEGVVEPLRGLFKDEVRALGRQLGLPRRFVERQPFPGPGLAVRVMGEITPEKLEILRNADAIFREEIAKRRIKADQYFAVLTDTRSVGVVGDFRTYNYVIALRAVKTSDFMTCEYAPISHKVLGTVSSRIVNEVKGAGRVVYDITGKPPATIEWC